MNEDIRRELETLLAEGKIDQEVHDRLLEGEGNDQDPPAVDHGLLSGVGAITLGLGLCYLIGSVLSFDVNKIAVVSILVGTFLAALGIRLVHTSVPGLVFCGDEDSTRPDAEDELETAPAQRREWGRAAATCASFLLTQGFLAWSFLHVDPDRFDNVLLALWLTLGALAYLSTSALVLLGATLWTSLWLGVFVLNHLGPEITFGVYPVAFAALGLSFLGIGREHLITRLPASPACLRFVLVYQTVGLNLVNWSVFLLAWLGWTGYGYPDVPSRMLGVGLAVLLYGLEAWAGRRSGLPWVTSISICHFLLQTVAILYYPYISFRNRALILVAMGLIMLMTASQDERGGQTEG